MFSGELSPRRPGTPPLVAQQKNPFRPKLERFDIIGLTDKLAAFLKEKGHPEACRNIADCDPWKYEPIVFDALIQERVTRNDPEEINMLREMIRAGSCMTYLPRIHAPEALALLEKIKQHEEARRNWKIVHADPDTATEHKQDLDEIRQELALVHRAIQRGALGADLEPIAQMIESLSARLWLQMKELLIIQQIPMQDVHAHYLTKPFYKELEQLRPVRDLIYYRLLYPTQAAKSLITRKPSAARPTAASPSTR